MSNTTYYAHDNRGITVPVTREAASRLSRSGLRVTAIPEGGSNDD